MEQGTNFSELRKTNGMAIGPIYTCDFSSLLLLFCDKMGIKPNWKICRKAMAIAQNL